MIRRGFPFALAILIVALFQIAILTSHESGVSGKAGLSAVLWMFVLGFLLMLKGND